MSGAVRFVSGVNLGAGPVGYGTRDVAALTGLTIGTVNQIAARGRVTPSIQSGRGSGHLLWWSPQDIVAVRVYTLLDIKDGEPIPRWWPTVAARIQTARLDELAGQYLIVEDGIPYLADDATMSDHIGHLTGPATVIPLDQCLNVHFAPPQATGA